MDQYENSEYSSSNYGTSEYDYDQPTQQRPPPSKYQVRPKVDADAEGEVDPSLYVTI